MQTVARPPVAPIGARNGEGHRPLRDSWGLRSQAMNFRRFAAGENGDDPRLVNPPRGVIVSYAKVNRSSPSHRMSQI